MPILICTIIGPILFIVGVFRCFSAITNPSWHQTFEDVIEQLLSPKCLRGLAYIALATILMMGSLAVMVP